MPSSRSCWLIRVLIVAGLVGAPCGWGPGPAGLTGARARLVWRDAGGQEPLSLQVEPGAPLSGTDFLLPFTLVDGEDRPLAVGPGDLRLAFAQQAAQVPQLVTFAPAPGGIASAVAVLADLRRLSGADRQRCADVLVIFARQATASAWRGIYGAGARVQAIRRVTSGGTGADGAAAGLSAAAVAHGLEGDARTPLWDNVKDALAELAFHDLPPRRALIVVTDALEERESRYTSASCLAAADSARVAVYAVLLSAPGPADDPTAGAGLSRLRRLAEGSGGRLLAAPADDAGGALRRLVAIVDAAQGARFAAPGLALPADAVLSVTHGGMTLTATGTVRARLALAERGIGRWPAILLAALALAAAGVALTRWRFASAGELVVTVGGRSQSHRLARSGATIGSAPGNTLVVGERRVSPHHAVVRVRQGQIILTDLRSTNGTQVNGQSVRTAAINEGDRVVLGGAVELVYHKTPPTRGASVPGRRGVS